MRVNNLALEYLLSRCVFRFGRDWVTETVNPGMLDTFFGSYFALGV